MKCLKNCIGTRMQELYTPYLLYGSFSNTLNFKHNLTYLAAMLSMERT